MIEADIPESAFVLTWADEPARTHARTHTLGHLKPTEHLPCYLTGKYAMCG